MALTFGLITHDEESDFEWTSVYLAERPYRIEFELNGPTFQNDYGKGTVISYTWTREDADYHYYQLTHSRVPSENRESPLRKIVDPYPYSFKTGFVMKGPLLGNRTEKKGNFSMIIRLFDFNLKKTAETYRWYGLQQADPSPTPPAPAANPVPEPIPPVPGASILVSDITGLTDKGEMAIKATVSGQPSKVVFLLTGPNGLKIEHTDSASPYQFLGDGQLWDSTQHPNGSYTMAVSAYNSSNVVAS